MEAPSPFRSAGVVDPATAFAHYRGRELTIFDAQDVSSPQNIHACHFATGIAAFVVCLPPRLSVMCLYDDILRPRSKQYLGCKALSRSVYTIRAVALLHSVDPLSMLRKRRCVLH